MTHLRTRNGAAPSALSFGTMQFGANADEAASAAMFEACRDAGLNFFDTAFIYTEGRSEEIYGRLAKGMDGDILTATKVNQKAPSTAALIRESFDTSRKRLGMESVDILYLHRFDPETPLEESIEALVQLQSERLIRYIGVSNFAAWQIVKADGIARRLGSRIDIVQPMYSLVKRQAEVEILPACADLGIAVAPYSPLGGGLLTGKYASGGEGRLSEDARYKSRYAVEWMHETGAALPTLAAEHGTTAATLAVAWVMNHPAVTSPIISARSRDQLLPSLDALRFDMSDALYASMTALSQTPAPATDRLEEG